MINDEAGCNLERQTRVAFEIGKKMQRIVWAQDGMSFSCKDHYSTSTS